MSTWPAIPIDVVDWFRSIFRAANWRLTETLLNVPSIRSTTLDYTLIQALLPHSAPTRFKSGAAVRMDVHNIGGLSQVMSWEIGDIAILVFLVRRSTIVRRKVAVLQAKRLYPSSGEVDDDDPVGFRYGMNALLRPEESPTSMLLRRAFAFDLTTSPPAVLSGPRRSSKGRSKTSKATLETRYITSCTILLDCRLLYIILSSNTPRFSKSPNWGPASCPEQLSTTSLLRWRKGRLPRFSS